MILLCFGLLLLNLLVVVFWCGGIGLELVDEVVELSKVVLVDYVVNVGLECMFLVLLKKGVGWLCLC